MKNLVLGSAGQIGNELVNYLTKQNEDVTTFDIASKFQMLGEKGIVEVKGPNVFKGYWKLNEKTKKEFREDGFFVTGDIGNLDKDGRLTLFGRSNDMFISGGYNVYHDVYLLEETELH